MLKINLMIQRLNRKTWAIETIKNAEVPIIKAKDMVLVPSL